MKARLPYQSICFGGGKNKRNERSQSGNESRVRINLTTPLLSGYVSTISWSTKVLSHFFSFIQVFRVYKFHVHFRRYWKVDQRKNIYWDLGFGEGFNPIMRDQDFWFFSDWPRNNTCEFLRGRDFFCVR